MPNACMLPWLLAAVTLAAVVLTAPLLGRHLFEVFDERPQAPWDRWLNPIEDALLRWIGDAGRSAESAAGYLAPLLISNGLFALPALALLLDAGDSGSLLRRWRDPDDGLLHPRSPLDGGQLQAWLALPAGPRLGRLIEHLSQERAFGRLPAALPSCPAEAEASLRAARRWWEAGDPQTAAKPAEGSELDRRHD